MDSRSMSVEYFSVGKRLILTWILLGILFFSYIFSFALSLFCCVHAWKIYPFLWLTVLLMAFTEHYTFFHHQNVKLCDQCSCIYSRKFFLYFFLFTIHFCRNFFDETMSMLYTYLYSSIVFKARPNKTVPHSFLFICFLSFLIHSSIFIIILPFYIDQLLSVQWLQAIFSFILNRNLLSYYI